VSIKIIILFTTFYLTTSCNRNICSEAALLHAFEKKTNALVAQDSITLKNIAVKNLSFTHSNGWVEDYKSFTSSGESKSLFYNAINIDSVKTIISDKTGLVRGVGNFDIIYKNNTLKLKLSFTETYVCINNEWKLFARHSSKL
jgi:hypothetical protein